MIYLVIQFFFLASTLAFLMRSMVAFLMAAMLCLCVSDSLFRSRSICARLAAVSSLDLGLAPFPSGREPELELAEGAGFL